jgi:hypothetical protein
MVAESNAEEREKDVPRIVREWVEGNPDEFGEGDNLRYREVVLDRCKKYLFAPDEFLNTMLKTFPENMKWYFNVFQTVFIAGLCGLGVSLTVLAINQFSAWTKETPTDMTILGWLIPIVILLLLAVPAFLINSRTGASWLSHWIQNQFRIIHNLRELQIEMYYISKILEIRNTKKQKEDSTGS